MWLKKKRDKENEPGAGVPRNKSIDKGLQNKHRY